MLEKLSKEYDIDIQTLEQIKTKIEKKYKNFPIPESEKNSYINLGILNFCKQEEYSKKLSTTFQGIVLTMPSINDGVRKRRLKAVEEYQKDPENAIHQGLVQELKDGCARFIDKNGIIIIKPYSKPIKTAIQIDNNTQIIPLDNVKTWESGSENFNYLKSLPEHKYFTTLQGFIFKDNKPIAFSMSYETPEENLIGFPMNKLVEFNAKVVSENNGITILKSVKQTKFKVISDDVKQYNDTIMNFYRAISVNDVEQVFKSQKTNYDINSIVGIVRNVHTSEATLEKPNPWSTLFLTTIDSPETFKIVCHPSLPVQKIIPGSYVKVWGTISKGNKYDPDTRKSTDEIEYSMFGSGVFVLGEFEDDNDNIPDNSDIDSDYNEDNEWES